MVTVFDLPLDVMRLVFNNLDSIYDFDAIAQFKQFEVYIVDYFAVLSDIDDDDYQFQGITLKKINVNKIVKLGSDGEQENSSRTSGFYTHFDDQKQQHDINNQIYQIVNHKEFFIINIHNDDCTALNIIPQLLKHKKYHTINFIKNQPTFAKNHVFFNRPYIKNELNFDDSEEERLKTIKHSYILLSQIPLLFYEGPNKYLKGPVQSSLDKFINLESIVVNIKSRGDTFILENLNLPNLEVLKFEAEGLRQLETNIHGFYDDRSIYFASNIDPASSPIGLIHCDFPKLKILNANFEFIAHCKFDSLKSLIAQYVKCLFIQDISIPNAETFKILRSNAARSTDTAYDMSYGEAHNIWTRWSKYGFPDVLASHFEIIPGMVSRSFNVCMINKIYAGSLMYTIPPEMKKWDMEGLLLEL